MNKNMLDLKSAQIELLNKIKEYKPFDDIEKIEQSKFINFLENNDNIYSRKNLTAHLTSSSWLVNKNKSKAFLIHHNIYKCWAPLGGHADNNTDLASVALKEAQEESGIKNITLINDKILDICILPVPEHTKKGQIVPSHFHFDIRYLLEADEAENHQIEKQEVSDGKWFDINEIQKLNIDIMPIIKRVIKKIHQQ